ncbi:Uncharacterised protein [Canicola haemoglobinophilus]|uniref:Uncharacterized protein n=1 Tax=Canicola haemoglobinophilus TaxID=733 RepID=A0AB38H5S5_9PAST|nr:hypothetical protein [Canicola haemoglobinophilus]STO54633.1 Uncharacterised protein [Canicola haemoglobinophilus]STO67592.1 Uncharacterised protein [Canicola haemoglobinophilus]
MGGSDDDLFKNLDFSFENPKPIKTAQYLLSISARPKNSLIMDYFGGFRVIIMTQANSQVNTRVLELLPKLKTKKLSGWCAV